jgi:hypothetical protein
MEAIRDGAEQGHDAVALLLDLSPRQLIHLQPLLRDAALLRAGASVCRTIQRRQEMRHPSGASKYGLSTAIGGVSPTG